MKDRIADLDRIAQVEADISVLKVVVDQLVPKLGLETQFGEWMEKVRKERARVMAELRTEMQSAFVASLDAAFKKHADEQAKTFKLYARIGVVFLIALVAKETGLIGLAKTFAGIP
jgi:hypothetical protein